MYGLYGVRLLIELPRVLWPIAHESCALLVSPSASATTAVFASYGYVLWCTYTRGTGRWMLDRVPAVRVGGGMVVYTRLLPP